MFRFDTVKILGGAKSIDYSIPSEPIGKYIVDTSHFVPRSEAVAGLSPLSAGDLSSKFAFDSKSGKIPSSAKIPIDRTHRLDRLVDTYENVMSQRSDISEKKAIADKQKALDDKYNKLLNNPPVQNSSGDSK